MKGLSLLLVLLAAKLAMAWGHAFSLTGWSLIPYTWQDVLVAVVLVAVDYGLNTLGAARGVAWAIYWWVALYAAINIPVARAVFTPLTWPMIRAARGALADSILMYVTRTNCLLIVLILILAAALPLLLQRMPRPPGKVWVTCAGVFLMLGVVSRTHAETHGMGRNAITALIDTGLSRVSARGGAADWRTSSFAQHEGSSFTNAGAPENLSWLEVAPMTTMW